MQLPLLIHGFREKEINLQNTILFSKLNRMWGPLLYLRISGIQYLLCTILAPLPTELH